MACQICEKECPPQCIYIVKDAVTRSRTYTGKLQFHPAIFDIDISVCMSCQICVEVCPFDAIKMDTEYELSTGPTASAACCSARSNWPSPTSITRRSIRPKLQKSMPASRLRKPRPKPKQSGGGKTADHARFAAAAYAQKLTRVLYWA